MFVPAAWNGRLVLWAHGFVDPQAPIAPPDVLPEDVAPWLVVESPESAISTVQSTTTTELAFIEAILSSGLSLP